VSDTDEAFRRLEEWRKSNPSRDYTLTSPAWEDPVWIVEFPCASKLPKFRERTLSAAVDAALKAWEKDNG
jgi:hypothetical protein